MLLKRQPTVEEFEEAALPHLNDLHRVATRSLADPTKADDVVQEAFLRAWKSFRQFRPGTNCRAWMFRILFNCIHDYRSRSSKLIAVGDDEIPLEQRLVHTEPVPEQLTDEDVLSALDRIPPDFRAAVLLADVEELSYKEIAEVLGIRMGTVMSRLSRGRKLLRVDLAEVARSYWHSESRRGGAKRMKVMDFDAEACEKMQGEFDRYMDAQLPDDTSDEVARHLEGCSRCSEELETRLRIKTTLKSAVQRTSAPPYLEARIRSRIRETPLRTNWFLAQVPAFGLAAALVVSLFAGRLVFYGEGQPNDLDRAAQEDYIDSLYARVSHIAQVGLGDHVHCAHFRKFEDGAPSLQELSQTIGPQYAGLVRAVRDKVPSKYRISLAHQCTFRERRFVHMAMHGDGTLLSVVITRRRPGESFTADQLAPVLESAGMPIYRSGVDEFQVAGFETGDYLAFVVSDLPRQQNTQFASNVASTVHEFLSGV